MIQTLNLTITNLIRLMFTFHIFKSIQKFFLHLKHTLSILETLMIKHTQMILQS